MFLAVWILSHGFLNYFLPLSMNIRGPPYSSFS
nr:MAG TPA: hypothetical protein [Caudoviricetes sp.]